jgi:hypothetical protein
MNAYTEMVQFLLKEAANYFFPVVNFRSGHPALAKNSQVIRWP